VPVIVTVNVPVSCGLVHDTSRVIRSKVMNAIL